LAKHDDLIERIIANVKQTEVHSKMEMDLNTDNKTEVVAKTFNEFDKIEDISSSIWAPVSRSSQTLSYYRKVLIYGVIAAGKFKVLYIELELKNNKKAFFLQLAWAVHFKKGTYKAEVYTESSDTKKPKSAKENNFSKKERQRK
ncbi:29518_t:CDS:2, partial [Gigaspora margarita]